MLFFDIIVYFLFNMCFIFMMMPQLSEIECQVYYIKVNFLIRYN